MDEKTLSVRRFREGVENGKKRRWYSPIDKIWAEPNLGEAFREVKRNKGAAGVDRVTVKAFESELECHVQALHHALRTKTYRPKPVKREFKERVKEITHRNQTVNVETLVKKKLNSFLRGWGNYFGHGQGITFFRQMDSWIRRRLRAVQLRSWKKVSKLHRELEAQEIQRGASRA